MWCWGDNKQGQTGNGGSDSARTSAVEVSVEQIPSLTIFKNMATSPNHTCAVITDQQQGSSGIVYCWGDPENNKLGLKTGDYQKEPNKNVEIANDTPLRATAVALGDNFSCALTDNSKKVMCWGGDEDANILAEHVTLINQDNSMIITQISATPTQICALMINESDPIWTTKIQCSDPRS